MDSINQLDLNFINYYRGTTTTFEFENNNYNSIDAIIFGKNNLDTNTNLIKYIRKFLGSSIYKKNAKIYLDRLAKNFRNTSDNNKFPKDMFSEDLILYFDECGMLFKPNEHSTSILDLVLYNKETVNYFDIRLPPQLKDKYIEQTHDYLVKLNIYLNSNILFSINIADILVYINYLFLLIRFIDNNNLENDIEYIDNHYKYFLNVLDSLFLIIHINNTIIISHEYMKNNRHMDDIYTKACEAKEESLRYIKILMDSVLGTKLLTNIENEEYLDSKSEHFNIILSILPFFTIEENIEYIFKNADSYSKIYNIIKKNIVSILDDSTVNSGLKTKFIRAGDNNLFNNIEGIRSLLKLYIDIEKYVDINNSYLERDKTRYYIVKLLNSYLDYSKLEYFKNLPEFDNLFIILTNNINNLLTYIQNDKSKLDIIIEGESHSFNVFDNNSYRLLIEINIVRLSAYQNLLNKIILHENILDKRMVIAKLAEMIYSILSINIKGSIYILSNMFRDILNEDYNYISAVHSKNIEQYFVEFFNMLRYLSTNETYIEYLLEHEELFDRNIYEKTIEKIGILYIDNNNGQKIKVLEMLEGFCLSMDKRIVDQSGKTKYDAEIPNEFLDPIMSTPIEIPVELPETQYIMDYNVIKQNLVFNHFNPFTRSPLTLEMLDEYNKKPEVLERIDKFRELYNNWKNIHKI